MTVVPHSNPAMLSALYVQVTLSSIIEPTVKASGEEASSYSLSALSSSIDMRADHSGVTIASGGRQMSLTDQ